MEAPQALSINFVEEKEGKRGGRRKKER